MTTPDEHLAILAGLCRVLRMGATEAILANEPDTAQLCLYRKAAIEWLLAETAYPIDETTPV